MKKTSKKPISSLTAVTLLLILVMGIGWGAGVYCLTSVTAEYAAARYLSGYEAFASSLSPLPDKGNSGEYENYDIHDFWDAVAEGGRANAFTVTPSIVDENDRFLKRPNTNRAYSATAIFDAEGNLVECSWKDFFYFEYLTAQQWQNREELSVNSARVFFDRELLTKEGEEIVSGGNLRFKAAALRFTGAFDGVTFTARKIEYIDKDEFWDAVHTMGGGQHTVSGVVEDHKLPWHTMYEDTSDALSDSKTVTFYANRFDVCYDRPSPAFSYKGAAYENAASLVAELGPALVSGLVSAPQQMQCFDDGVMILPSVNYCFQVNDELYSSPNFHGENGFADGVGCKLHFYTVSVVYCDPWQTAFDELRFVYLITLLLSVTAVLAVRFIIKRHLIRPVQAVGNAIANAEDQVSLPPPISDKWRESQLLQDGFSKCWDRLQLQKDEIARLNTALEYAKTAEQNRRQMTSNLAHELKTPLAVICSYAEGLKERIAEDKRDKYIDVILSEVRRTDGMVLEMLELSRLEAGKVKLSRNDFSLIALTRSVFEKLEMAAQAKDLKITFSFPEEFTVTADEARIAQVIENFATNAVKYTPTGGRILVEIQTGRSGTTFSIENDSAPLTQEALNKVWDSFYRTDEARNGNGTGLGLAIAKNIVQLHGGKCSVHNTKTGVVFRFTI